MKIAVATDDNINVTGHVGRCAAFIVYTIEENKIISKEIRENNFTHHGRGNHEEGEHHHHGQGAGQHGHDRLIEGLKDCAHIIFHGGGWRLLDDLKANNISPIITPERVAETAVEKFIAGTLEYDESLVCRHD